MIKPILYPGENNESNSVSLFSLGFADGSAIRFWVFGYIYLIRDWNNLELMEQRMGWMSWMVIKDFVRVSDLDQEESDFVFDFDFG